MKTSSKYLFCVLGILLIMLVTPVTYVVTFILLDSAQIVCCFQMIRYYGKGD